MAPIDDWAAALRCPRFWHSYYETALSSSDETRDTGLGWLEGPATGCDDARLWGPDPYDAFTDDMSDDEQDAAMQAAMAAGSVLSIPLPGGAAWTIRFSSSPGIYHRLVHPDAENGLSLGYDDPHFHLPILRWAEVPPLVAGVRRYWRTLPEAPFPAEFLLPLLAPVVGGVRADEQEPARRLLARAWADTGMVGGERAGALAALLVHASDTVRWAPHPVFGWINNGRHSHRNPANGFWSPESFARFRSALDAAADAPRAHAPGSSAPAVPEPDVVWRFDTGGAASPSLAVADGRVSLTSGTTGEGRLWTLDAGSGAHVWSARIEPQGFTGSAPVLHGTTVYQAGGTQEFTLRAFDAAGPREDTGAPSGARWAVTLEEKHYGVSAAYAGSADCTPVVVDGTVFVAEDQLHAVEERPQGPVPLWDAHLTSLNGELRSTPVIGEGRVLVAVTADSPEPRRAAATAGGRVDEDEDDDVIVARTRLQAFDAKNGGHLWTVELGRAFGQPVFCPAPASGSATGPSAGPATGPATDTSTGPATGAEVLVPAGALTAVHPVHGEPLWSVRTEREWAGTIAVTDDLVIGTACRLHPGDAGDPRPEWAYTMVGVDRHRREVVWTFTDPRRMNSRGVAVAGGTAYSVGYDDLGATLYAVDIATGRLRWRFELGRSTALPAVSDDLVYVSDASGSVLALRRPSVG